MTKKANLSPKVLSALQLWQTFEYLSPQTCPEEKQVEMSCVWHMDPKKCTPEKVPWRDPHKIVCINKFFKKAKNYRFQFFAGIITGSELVETARDILKAAPIDFSEQKDPADVASFVVPLDKEGRVSGEIFVSSVPWALKCIKKAQENGSETNFSFTGFFGPNGVEKKIKDAVRVWLLSQQLIVSEESALSIKGASTEKAQKPQGQTHTLNPSDVNTPMSDVNIQHNIRPLDLDDVREIAKIVFEKSGWGPKEEGMWAIKTEQAPQQNQGRQTDDPLNSFFAEDLEKVQRAYESGDIGLTLKKFLEIQKHPQRVDLEENRQHLINGVHPNFTPSACWPGEHPLVIAQQFAVNAIMNDLVLGGLFSVNGPPGTGKTTLLKDIVAAIVCQRAETMAQFDSPLDAFIKPIVIENASSDYGSPYLLDESLRGFGIVVACSGNVAAENISKELPSKSTISTSISIDYFSEVANSMGLPSKDSPRSDKNWGMISAPLGNSANRNAFVSSFWFGQKEKEEESISQVLGNLKPITLQALMKILFKNNNVPDWDTAKKAFIAAFERSRAARTKAANIIQHLNRYEELLNKPAEWMLSRECLVSLLKTLNQDMKNLQDSHEKYLEKLRQAMNTEQTLRELGDKQKIASGLRSDLSRLHPKKPKNPSSEINNQITAVKLRRVNLQQDLDGMNQLKPSWWQKFWGTKAAQQWKLDYTNILNKSIKSGELLDKLENDFEVASEWEKQWDDISEKIILSNHEIEYLKTKLTEMGVSAGCTFEQAKEQTLKYNKHILIQASDIRSVQKRITQCQKEIKEGDEKNELVTKELDVCRKALDEMGLLEKKNDAWHLKDSSRDVFHKSSPYDDSPDLFDARRDLFVAAMDLHKAFIFHSWKKLRPTLNAMIGILNGQIQPQKVQGGPMVLWDALFLVVPLISTTFASFPRLFRGVGCEGIAWVLIDEAGQASPQACIGALWRAKRAVIVGDPLQLEPVVGIPEELVYPIQKRCGTRSEYIPPNASVQTMADISNKYGSYLKNEDTNKLVWLGSPLIVHRRCLNPMFDIANSIAYNGKMVYGSSGDSLINKSQWIHIRADSSDEHWISSQGQSAVKKIRELVGETPEDDNGQPLIYIITPFKSVSEKMRALLKSEFDWKDAVIKKLCGTVHTFQGKEARDVIFLLGGNPKKPGVIKGFAGKNPNLVNVAVTRAKKRLYVIGDIEFWTGKNDIKGFYFKMYRKLHEHNSQ